MAVQRDPAVDNLESFITLLTETIDRVQEETPHLDTHAKALDEIQDGAEAELGGLDRELEDGVAAFDALADETKDAIDRLEATATTGADGDLDEAADAFGEWEGKLGSTLDDAAERVNTAAEELKSDGFEEAQEALEESTRALGESRDATESGFEAFRQKLQHEGERFAGSLVKASMAAEEAAGAAKELESEFEGKANATTEEIKGSSTSALSDHSATKSQLESFYDGIESRAQSEAKDVVSEMQEVFRMQGDQIRQETQATIDEGAESVVTDGLTPFDEEISEWRTQTDGAEKELSAWDAFVEELAATLIVVGLIDQVKESME